MGSSSAPAVSVIVAAYNAADTIGRALASAQEQTLENIEILVVDDASTDATREVVRRVAEADPRVRVVQLARNGGPGAARNAGIEAARGAWVATLDADDRYLPTRLEGLLALAAETGSEMVADNLALDGAPDSRGFLLERSGGALEIDVLAFVRSNRGARGQGRVSLGFLKPVVRASFLADHGVRYPPVRLAEDYFFALGCLTAGATWTVTREPTYRYAVRGTSLTATYRPADVEAVALLDLELAQTPGVLARPALLREVRRHGRAAHDAAVWTEFVLAIRSRDARVAWRTATAGNRAARVVATRGPTAVARAVGRRLRRAQS
ncbi:MAG: glycosyltransferase [Nocardioides sp.]|nr:glycosyltransferase [Nocardioides sp.]